MIYNSDFFYNPHQVLSNQNLTGSKSINVVEVSEFTISESDIQKVKLLKPSISNESSYYDKMLVWKLSDNPHIKDINELSRIFVVMQLISITANIDTKLYSKFGSKPYFISLLRRLYLDFDRYSSSVQMGFKRPFGNSNVLQDVREEVDFYSNIRRDDEDDNPDYSNEEKILSDFVDFLSEFYKEGFTLNWRHFTYHSKFVTNNKTYIIDWNTVIDKKNKNIEEFCSGYFRMHHYLSDWTLDPCEIREEKIDTILK